MRLDILGALKGFSKIWPKEIDDDLIEIWQTVLADLTTAELQFAIEKYCKYGKNYFPSPGEIYKIARPESGKEAQAANIVDRIYYAVRAYGRDKLGEQRAKDKIGEIGWLHIQNSGGWNSFLDGLTNEDDLPIYKAQSRKSIVGILEQKELEQIPKSSLIEKRQNDKPHLNGPASFIPTLVKAK